MPEIVPRSQRRYRLLEMLMDWAETHAGVMPSVDGWWRICRHTYPMNRHTFRRHVKLLIADGALTIDTDHDTQVAVITIKGAKWCRPADWTPVAGVIRADAVQVDSNTLQQRLAKYIKR